MLVRGLSGSCRVRSIVYLPNKTPLENYVRMERMRVKSNPRPVSAVGEGAVAPPEHPNDMELNRHQYQRKAKMAAVVRQLAEEFILAEGNLKTTIKNKIAMIDPVTTGFQIRGVRVSDNCAHCTIRWCCKERSATTHTPDEETRKLRITIEEILTRLTPKLRFAVGKVLDYRLVPTITFLYDVKSVHMLPLTCTKYMVSVCSLVC